MHNIIMKFYNTKKPRTIKAMAMVHFWESLGIGQDTVLEVKFS